MKKNYQNIFTIGMLILIFFSACDKSGGSSKIQTPFDENYLTENQFDQKPEFANKNDYKKALEDINKSIAEYKSISEITSEDLVFEAFVYVNENGEVDKLFVIDAPSEKVVQIISEELMKMKFEPATKDENPVPARFKFKYNISSGLDEQNYFVAVEEMPAPIGGINAIADNVIYPKSAKEKGIQGRVFVKAYIDTNGSVVKTKIIKGIDSELDKAAREAVEKTKFTPGKQRDKKVNVQVSIPIMFKLQ